MTSVTYRPCKQGHLGLILPQPHDKALLPAYLSPAFKTVLENSFSMSAWAGLKPIGAAGVIPMHGECALAWAMLGAEAGPYLTQITRKVREVLDNMPYKRVEMRVIYDFEEGHRWARLLGFGEPEAPRMRKSGARGEDETLYARVRA